MATPRRQEKKARTQAVRQARLESQRRKQRMKGIAILAVIGLIVGSLVILSNVNSDDKESADSATTTTTAKAETVKGDTPCPAADGSSPRSTLFEKLPPTCIDPNKVYTAIFDTTEGAIEVELDTKRTPVTTNSFVVLSRYHYYDGTKIFRTDQQIDIIQGGSPHSEDNADSGPGYTVPDEGTPFTYKEGDLVMARTQAPNSSGGQFFFGAGPNVSKLDSPEGPYLNFGHTTKGVEVLRSILALNQGTGQLGGAPSRTVTVNKVTITEK